MKDIDQIAGGIEEHGGVAVDVVDPAKTLTKDKILVHVAGKPTDKPVPVAKVLLNTVVAVKRAGKVDKEK